MVCGNKNDLNSQRAVTLDEAQSKASNLNVHFAEVSAKTGTNVKNLFETVARALPGLNSIPSSGQQEVGQVKLQQGNSTKQQGGCKC